MYDLVLYFHWLRLVSGSAAVTENALYIHLQQFATMSCLCSWSWILYVNYIITVILVIDVCALDSSSVIAIIDRDS